MTHADSFPNVTDVIPCIFLVSRYYSRSGQKPQRWLITVCRDCADTGFCALECLHIPKLAYDGAYGARRVECGVCCGWTQFIFLLFTGCGIGPLLLCFTITGLLTPGEGALYMGLWSKSSQNIVNKSCAQERCFVTYRIPKYSILKTPCHQPKKCRQSHRKIKYFRFFLWSIFLFHTWLFFYLFAMCVWVC